MPRPRVGIHVPNGGVNANVGHRYIGNVRRLKGFSAEWATIIKQLAYFGPERWNYHGPFGFTHQDAMEADAYPNSAAIWPGTVGSINAFIDAIVAVYEAFGVPVDTYGGSAGASPQLTKEYEAASKAKWQAAISKAFEPIIRLREAGVPGIHWNDVMGAVAEGTQDAAMYKQLRSIIKDTTGNQSHIGVEPRPYLISPLNNALVPSIITDTYFQTNDAQMVTPGNALGPQYVIISDTQANGTPHTTDTYAARCTLHLQAGRSIYVQPGTTTTGSKTAAQILTDAGINPATP